MLKRDYQCEDPANLDVSEVTCFLPQRPLRNARRERREDRVLMPGCQDEQSCGPGSCSALGVLAIESKKRKQMGPVRQLPKYPNTPLQVPYNQQLG